MVYNSVCERVYKKRGEREFVSIVKEFLSIYGKSLIKINVSIQKPKSDQEPFTVSVKGITNNFGNIQKYEEVFRFTDVTFYNQNHRFDGAWRKFLHSQLPTKEEKQILDLNIVKYADDLEADIFGTK